MMRNALLSRTSAALRSASAHNRTVAWAGRSSMIGRTFSSDCEPAQKLQSVLENYRQTHFSREIPSRFQKELFTPYATSNGTMIPIEHVNTMLVNIGQEEHVLSSSEQEELLREAGIVAQPDGISEDGMIPTNTIMELLSRAN
uniref:Uncharacterized protein n=1 Tax=Craspedostauros australis TaxID=1486917 RepID=A0A7R9ZLH9_9STRA|mmetsp:Transcript_16137/g.44704  ORF Transcript_16137/g.44704 Transcript_16137/m.44704 type:complete len:143 (+) Transcript_16137:390-818(+)|eukprot:CAMPEP_0198133204 /NCGR_PEP_ID=MMETSP1442-20131203/59442_1 /TAXON_ID= /ORGANISM="Craspedostauros australis, Strain CCMP3328" /LENGTH=142 /DNA_ID=CAMNT_0043794315 /DNA_START=795 /DNA_END=1223 /DNA_ORIENTATION=+